MTAETRLLDSIDDGFITVDSAFRVRFCNAAAATLLGVLKEQLLGHGLFDAASSLQGTPAEIAIRAGVGQPQRIVDAALHAFDDRSFEIRIAPGADDAWVLQFTELTQRVERDRRVSQELAMLAHDLRNPLAPLRTSLELLKRPSIAEATKERARTIMERQLVQMVDLIDRLQDLSRGLAADAGSSQYKPREPRDVPAAADGGSTADEPAGAVTGGQGARVLVADDSALVQQSVVALLRAEGYEVRTVSDGFEAIAAAAEWQPRYVLLDLHMPRLGGMEAAKRLRQAHPAGTMILLMMSGVALDDSWRSHARQAGFDACLDKTADPTEWLAAMRRAGAAAAALAPQAGLTSAATDASSTS